MCAFQIKIILFSFILFLLSAHAQQNRCSKHFSTIDSEVLNKTDKNGRNRLHRATSAAEVREIIAGGNIHLIYQTDNLGKVPLEYARSTAIARILTETHEPRAYRRKDNQKYRDLIDILTSTDNLHIAKPIINRLAGYYLNWHSSSVEDHVSPVAIYLNHIKDLKVLKLALQELANLDSQGINLFYTTRIQSNLRSQRDIEWFTKRFLGTGMFLDLFYNQTTAEVKLRQDNEYRSAVAKLGPLTISALYLELIKSNPDLTRIDLYLDYGADPFVVAKNGATNYTALQVTYNLEARELLRSRFPELSKNAGRFVLRAPRNYERTEVQTVTVTDLEALISEIVSRLYEEGLPTRRSIASGNGD